MPEAGPDGGGGQLAVALWFVRLRRLRNGDADADGGGGSSGDGGGGGGDGGGGGGRSMSTEDRLALLSVAIWVVAVAALAVALAFSAAEFAAAQRNPAVGVVIAPVADLRLPVVSFCSSTPGVPAFLGGGVGTAAAAGARGLPLLTLARVQHVQTGEVVGWPASGELIATAAHAGGADGGGDGDGSGGGGVGGGDGGGGCVAALGSLHMGALGRRAAAEWAAVTGSPAPAAAASTPEEDARSRCHACVAVGLRRPVVLRDPAPLVWGRGAAASAAGTRSRAAAAAAARGGSSRSAAAVAAAAAAARNPAYRVEVVESRALDYCTRIADGRSSLLLDGLVAEIAGAAAAFVDAGVLASAFPAAADAPALGFELADVVRAAASAERVLRRPSRAVSAADVADATAALNGARSFVCSVYFFSGVLYPVADAPDVAYRYEIRGGAWGWEPTGAGPYWVPPPVVTLSEVAAAAAAVASAAAAAVTATTPSPSAAPGSSAVVTGANEDSLTVYATDRSLVSAAGAAAALSTGGGGVGNATTAVTASAGVWLSPRDRMDILQPFSLTTYTLDKRVDDRDGARWAPSTTSAVDVTRVAANSWRHAWVELRVDAFVERLIERRPTTSVSEFLADVFELIGLFTGLCVYTVVVMPAQMVARNKRMAERAVARDLHTAVRRE